MWSCRHKSYYFVIYYGQSPCWTHASRVHFAILIDYSSARSRHLLKFIRSRFDGYISYLSFARNSSGKKEKRKKNWSSFRSDPYTWERSTIHKHRLIYLLSIQVYTCHMAYRATVGARACIHSLQIFTLYKYVSHRPRDLILFLFFLSSLSLSLSLSLTPPLFSYIRPEKSNFNHVSIARRLVRADASLPKISHNDGNSPYTFAR